MFYWSHRDTHVVLTNAEESDLVRQVASSPIEAAMYSTDRTTRRRLERRVVALLQRTLEDAPEIFRRNYCYRTCYDDEARRMFPIFLDAYGRITRLAIAGRWSSVSALDEVSADLLESGPGRFYVSLLRGSGVPWRYRPFATLSIPEAAVHRLVGTCDDFLLMTTVMNIRFGRRAIRLTTFSEVQESEDE